jgi:hypothetical protein
MALFRNATAPNAMLVVDSGQARLVYAPQFFAMAYGAFGDSGILAIIAHEVGHGLDDTMGAAWVKESWPAELRADAWAGCVLAKLDLDARGLDPSLRALEKYPAPSHPVWSVRLPVIRTGYTQCGGSAANFGTGARK